jgi:DNA-binding response OmpR family regulator
VLPAAGRDDEPMPAIDVAIVEDDAVLAELLRHTLETAGYTCAVLNDGQDALEAFVGPGQRVDARSVLLDVDVPGRSGLEVLGEFRRAGILQDLPVLVVTGRATDAEVVQTLSEGAAEHIAKPFSVPLLVRKVQRALGD